MVFWHGDVFQTIRCASSAQRADTFPKGRLLKNRRAGDDLRHLGGSVHGGHPAAAVQKHCDQVEGESEIKEQTKKIKDHRSSFR